MNFDLLRYQISRKFRSQGKFAEKLGVSRRTLLNWIAKKSIPENRLFSVLELLDLTDSEEDELLKRPKLCLIFRGRP
jgi:transcriptional regulator with XRE-family HTH domain